MSGYRFKRQTNLEDLPSIRVTQFKHGWRSGGEFRFYNVGMGWFSLDKGAAILEAMGLGTVISLSETPLHFGGCRLFMHCPECASRREVLYLRDGLKCRGCLGLMYKSQSRGAIDGCHLQMRRISRRLDPDWRYLAGEVPQRPKGMHQTTYQRQADAIHRQSQKLDRAFIGGAVKWFKGRQLKRFNPSFKN